MKQVEWAACGTGPCENRQELTDLRSRLDAAESKLAAAEAVLRSIAQYDPRWTGQRVNDMPSRAQLIAKAFDALAADRALSTTPEEPRDG